MEALVHLALVIDDVLEPVHHIEARGPVHVHPRPPEREVGGAGDVGRGEAALRGGRRREDNGSEEQAVLAEAKLEPVRKGNPLAGEEVDGRVPSPRVGGDGNPAAAVGAAEARVLDVLREVEAALGARLEAEEGGCVGAGEEEPG
uniref:Uncharacterized protein n=1 Tax=Arundo donax TaxID=35708 RepID=A0A0A8Z2N8_ARUDO